MNDTVISPTTLRIQLLNNLLRKTQILGGQLVFTTGFRALSPQQQMALLGLMQDFDDFTADNDPYGEHDFGAVEHEGIRVFWKIDYYDLSLRYRSDNPADPLLTRRVLTVMLAEEY